MSKLRVGIIGTGFGALVQAPGFSMHPEVEVVALAGVARPGRAQEQAAQLGIPRAYNTYTEMLDSEALDLVSVVSAPYLHRPMAIAALERRIPVLCEKPMALNLAEAQAMIDAAERRGLVNAIDFEFRYAPSRVQFKMLMDQGYIGDLLHFTVTYTMPGYERNLARPMGWLWRTETGGGMLGALGSHLVDTLRWFFGDLKAVSGITTAHVDVREGQPADADDTFAFLAQLGGKATGVVQFFQHAHHGFGLRVEAFGTKGTLVLVDDNKVLGARAGESLAEIPLETSIRIEGLTYPEKLDARTYPFVVLVDNLVAALRGNPRTGPRGAYATFRDGAAVQAVLDAVRQSHAERRWVDVAKAF
ncbi:MAG TPA: Gfo/Idh/MocA family oxidoreductase [Symbiobacteriaceae bacterium]|jgi:predicted dehydrogenase|nr:Gfo/Idh/MocA family oxidoreductase [Symbiobacteriaceae bacterium]